MKEKQENDEPLSRVRGCIWGDLWSAGLFYFLIRVGSHW